MKWFLGVNSNSQVSYQAPCLSLYYHIEFEFVNLINSVVILEQLALVVLTLVDIDQFGSPSSPAPAPATVPPTNKSVASNVKTFRNWQETNYGDSLIPYKPKLNSENYEL